MLTRGKKGTPLPLNLAVEKQHKRDNRAKRLEMTAHNQNMEALMKKMEEFRAWKENQERRAQEAQQPPLNQMFEPPTQQFQGGEWGAINANNFELKSGLIQMIKSEQFGGSPMEDPNTHLSTFLDMCDTVKLNGVSNDAIRMRMFGFSLRDRAKDWYKSLNKADIHTWDELCKAFLNKYFPPSKAQKLIYEISHFSQQGDESLFEAWERYRELLRKCPQHGFNEGQQITNFYSGLTSHTRSIVDATSGGCLVNRNAREALRIIEEMTANSYQWPMERTLSRKVSSIVDEKYEVIANELANMKKKYEETQAQLKVCQSQEMLESEVIEDVNFVNQRNYGNYRQGFQGNTQENYQGGYSYGNQGGNLAYHPNNRSHPNLSYGNPNNAQNPPPGFSSNQGNVEEQKKTPSSMEQLLQQLVVNQGQMATQQNNMANQQNQMANQQSTFIQQTGQKVTTLENNIISLSKQVMMLEGQVKQVANQVVSLQKAGEASSSKAHVNPIQQCKTISVVNEVSSKPSHIPQGKKKTYEPLYMRKKWGGQSVPPWDPSHDHSIYEKEDTPIKFVDDIYFLTIPDHWPPLEDIQNKSKEEIHEYHERMKLNNGIPATEDKKLMYKRECAYFASELKKLIGEEEYNKKAKFYEKPKGSTPTSTPKASQDQVD